MADRPMKIGKVADLTGLTTQAIRYYEREGLLPEPGRTHTSYRVYTSEVIGKLRFIKHARHLGLSLDEIKAILRMSKAGRAPCCKVRELLAGKLQELDRAITDLSRFRRELRRFLHTIAGMPDQADTSPQVCKLIQLAPSSVSSPSPPQTHPAPNPGKRRNGRATATQRRARR